MKKLLFISVLLCLAIGANAQKWQHGVKAGMNISTVTLPDNSQSPINPGFVVGCNVGAVINYNINERFAVEADLMYSMQGMKDKLFVMEGGLPTERQVDYKIRSQYINLPIALKYFLMDGLYIECGPQVGYLLSKADEADGI